MNEKFISNCELAIHFPDLSKAERFYADIPGFKLLSKTDDMLEFDTGALRLYIKKDHGFSMSFIPSLDVKDVDRSKKYLSSKECEIFNESEEGFYLKDPFGFVIDVIGRK